MLNMWYHLYLEIRIIEQTKTLKEEKNTTVGRIISTRTHNFKWITTLRQNIFTNDRKEFSIIGIFFIIRRWVLMIKEKKCLQVLPSCCCFRLVNECDRLFFTFSSSSTSNLITGGILLVEYIGYDKLWFNVIDGLCYGIWRKCYFLDKF